MTRLFRAGSAVVSVSLALYAVPAAAQLDAPATTAAPTNFTIKGGTQVRLMVVREVTSASAGPGQRVELRVDRAVMVDGKVVIPAGAPAWGRIVAANPQGSFQADPMISVALDRIDLGKIAIPIQGKRINEGEATMPDMHWTPGMTIYTARWYNAKVKAGEIVSGTVVADVAIDLPAMSAALEPMRLVRPAPTGKKNKRNLNGPFIIVNPDVGVPVFPYDFPNVPYTVLGEIEVGVREGNTYSPEPSQEKIYHELWERGAKMGADAVINARYDDPELSVFSAKKTDSTGIAIRFDIPVEAATTSQVAP